MAQETSVDQLPDDLRLSVTHSRLEKSPLLRSLVSS